MKHKQPQSSCKLRYCREKFKTQLSELLKFADEISQQAAFPVDQIGLSNNCNRWLTQAKTLMTDSFTSDYFCAQMVAKNNNVIDNGPVSNLCQMVRLQAEYLRGLEAQINSIPVCFCCMLHNSFKNLFGKKTMIFITLLTLFLGISPNVLAWNWGGGTCYFDNSQWQWTSVTGIHIWNDKSSTDWTATKVEGSDYWEISTTKWDNFTAFKFYYKSGDSWKNETGELTSEFNSGWWGNCYDPAEGKWVLVGPKNVGISNEANVLGGDGSESNPYIVLPGTEITVTATGSKIDNNSTVNFKFNSGSYGTTETYTVVSSAAIGQTYNVKATVKTVRGSETSREFTTKTIYYAVANFKLVGDYCGWSFASAQAFDANNEVTISALTGSTKSGYSNGFKVMYTDSWDNSYGAYTNPYELKPGSSAYGLLKGSDSKNFTSPVDYTNAKFKLEWKDKEGTPTLHLEFVSATFPTYAVTLDPNGGTINAGNITQYTYATGATLPTDVTKTGYTFAGWFLNNAGSRVNSISTTDIGAKSFTAHWTAKTYTITLDGNGATVAGSPSSITATYDQQLPASLSNFTAPQKTGYVFLGYYDNATEGQGTQYYNASGVCTWNEYWTTDAGATLYAQWHVQTYKVTFGVHTSNHGTLNATVGGNAISSGDQVDASATVTFTATPATADYVVEGWYSNAACTERIEAAKAHTEYSITLTENTEVYVKFAQAYTVHFGEIGDLIDKGELAVTYYDESIVDGAQVAEGSNVVFSATNLVTNYTVQGWFADQQATSSLEGVSGYAISPNRETLTATISKDVNVYVRYFAPEIVSAITLKVDGSVPSVYQIGETITAEPTTTGGDGTKVYNWQLKQDGVPVSTTFTVNGKKVSFNVESIGNYTITLTINDATTGFFNSTCTSAEFEVKEPVYYIIGSQFWNTAALEVLNSKAISGDPSQTGCKGEKDIHLQPAMEKGVYYFGPWTFGQDYDAFWIYDAIKHKSMSGTAENGYYAKGADHRNYESGIPLVETPTGSSGFYTNNKESSGHSDLGQHDWYLFVKNGKVWFNTNAPDLTAYVRLVVTADKQYYSNEILMPEDGVQSEILSFYSKEGATYKIQKQEPGKGWTDLQVVTVPSISEGGIYTITFTKSNNEITMGTPAAYTGDYYVRTDALDSWDDYKTNPKAKMRYTEGARNNAFNYYLCKWCDNENINVHFAVANDYNSNLLGTYTNDVICNEGKLLGQKASVRFMFMHKTGELARAYLCGTIEDQFLRVINNQSSGKKIYSNAEKTQEVTDLKFEDSQDFVYPIDVYAQPGAQIALRAKYKSYYQFFYGTGSSATGDVTGYDYLIGNNESTDANAYHMQMVYDFKTDRLVAGWIPGDNEIDGSIDLHSDAIITREHQGDLRSIRFANDESGVFHVKTLYAELQLNKSIMTDGHTQDAEKIYERNVYWISFPFDVRVGDIFGVDGYGTKWVIQKYNGAKRAQIGWFAETSTFWEQMEEDEIMYANVGYSLNLDPNFFDQESDEVWSNGKASVSFRFPSMIHNFDVISNGEAQSFIPKHTCTIDRTFGNGKNHKITDSNWNVFGIPTFQNLVNPTDLPFESYYVYNPSNNTYTPQTTTNSAEFTLKASYSYFIQWGSVTKVTWPKASIINELAPAPYHYADAKNYMVELFFSYGDKEDHTYINLKDEAKQDFVLNEDMMKVTNSGQPNIYSYAGAYDVAYNATAFENQTINLGVIARKNGSYTFSMPKDFSGSAILVDLEDGTATDLNVSNYSVDLNKGTYNNRFQLMLKVEASTPTNIDNVDGAPDGLKWNADGKTKKLLINDQIYLINGGRVYNATGVQLR